MDDNFLEWVYNTIETYEDAHAEVKNGNITIPIFMLKELYKYANDENGAKNYKQMAKAFIGDTIKDFFCNGFFGSSIYDLRGAEIIKVYDSDDDNAIVIEVKKNDGRYDYGYFDGGWRDWKSVYEHLQEWTNRE